MTDLALSVIATVVIGGPIAWWQALYAPFEPRRIRRTRHRQIDELYFLAAIAITTLEVCQPPIHSADPAACQLCAPLRIQHVSSTHVA